MNDARSLFSPDDQNLLNQLARQMQHIIQHSLIWENTDPVNIIAAGGWFASKLQGQRPKDVDIFILCGDTYKDTYEIYLKVLFDAADAKGVGLRQSELSYNHNHKIWGVFSDQSVTPNIQYIFSKHRDRQRLVNEFDYAHTMISFCMNRLKLYTTYKSFDAAKNKKLIPINDPQPWRRDKFIARGYVEIENEKKSDPPWVPFLSTKPDKKLEDYHKELMKAFTQQQQSTSFLQFDDIVAGQSSYPRIVEEAIQKRNEAKQRIADASKRISTFEHTYTFDDFANFEHTYTFDDFAKEIKKLDLEAKREESTYSPRKKIHDTIRDGLKKLFGKLDE